MNERSIFAAALDITDPAERSAYLDQACAGNAELRHNVEDLLAAQEDLGSFLARPPILPVPTVTYEPIAEGPGSVIGRYKLLQQIGEGGFGAVYMAEQREPVKRRVALKIIKLGMDSREIVARFEAERQALALMDHPNIAKVLDAGATSTARPFFVMELVKGVPITEFCDQNHLPAAERLRLFVQVCQAVQHAHQKGVIHRDLKPSNVLVTLHDGRPVPKVIDFGVAKALNQELTERTLFTAYGHMIGTPQYMSPEQAEMSGLDVDTRADVYSLGVLLYELLTGTTPLEAAALRKAGYAEMQRLIREEEPPRPSQRVSTLGEQLSVVARDRGCEPSRLGPLLRGELDWIVLKALEKERGRRYESASNFAADVQRFLASEPVEAHPPSVGYRVRKFVRRNRGPVIAAAAMVALLCLGLAGTFSGMIVARNEAERATAAEMESVAQRDMALRETAEKERARQAATLQEAIARDQAAAAQAAREALRRTLYVSRANLIQAAWDVHNVSRVLELLEQQRPGPGEEDLRGFEWHYFDRLCHAELRELKLDYNLITNGVLNTPQFQHDPLVAFSADGTRCATFPMFRYLKLGQQPAKNADGDTINVWDLATGRKIFEAPSERLHGLFPYSRLVLSPDGRRLVIGKDSGGGVIRPTNIEVWDVDSKNKVRTISDNMLTSLALSPDGRYLAGVPYRPSAKGDAKPEPAVIRIWDLDGNQPPLEFERPNVSLGSPLTFTADGKRLLLLTPAVLARVEQVFRATTFEAATGKQLGSQQLALPQGWGPGSYQREKVFSPDGSRLIAFLTPSPPQARLQTDDQHQAVIWDVGSGKQLASFPAALRGRCSAAFSPDGKRVASWGTETNPVVTICNADSGRLIKTIVGHTTPVVSASFSANGARLVSADAVGIVKEWDARGTVPNKTEPASGLIVVDSPDRSRRLVAHRPGRNPNAKGTPTEIRVQDAAGKDLFVFSGHKSPVNYLRISPGGRHAISMDNAGVVKVWEVDAGSVLLSTSWGENFRRSNGFGSNPTGAEFSPDGRRLAAAIPDGGVKAWELDGFREIFSVGDKALGTIWTPDSRRILIVLRHDDVMGPQLEIKLWDVATRRELYTGRTSQFHFSRDRKLLALIEATRARQRISPAEVKVLDLATGAELARFQVEANSDAGCAFSADGNLLAISNGADVLIASIPTGRELFRLKGHSVSADAVAFSPDGKRLVSATGGGLGRPHEFILWDLRTGSELMRLPHRRDASDLTGLSFSADGFRIQVLNGTEIFDGTPRSAEKRR